MALTAYIQPVTVVDKEATQLSQYVINYDLQGQNCQTYWQLQDASGSNIYDGNWSVPQDVLEIWGTDDTIIIASLAQDKGFVITGYPTGSVQEL